MAVQYSDYPADNHQLAFRELRRRLNSQPLTSYSYGGIILLGSMVPVLNIFVTPLRLRARRFIGLKKYAISINDATLLAPPIHHHHHPQSYCRPPLWRGADVGWR
ncbi:EI24 domain-containing protein [Cellvibrio sp. PSBB023]|uniref:EI24 domain-containing protein n=1 Tax=Cellvibrio sp. PSBB023 TaxID=1945512 RepID=UPI00352F3546